MQALEDALQKSIRSPLFGLVLRAQENDTTTAEYLKQIEKTGPTDSKNKDRLQKSARTTGS